jgi:hypothetical protein
MRHLFAPTMALAVALASSSARADGFVHRLPKDGSWVLYALRGVEEDENSSEPDMVMTGTLRIASVGSAKVDDEPCRWIEMTMSWKGEQDGRDAREGEETCKLLIPEKYLTKGEAPADHILRGWQKKSFRGKESPPRELNLFHAKPYAGFASVFLLGPPENLEKLGEKVVESKLGKLPCKGFKGTQHVEFPAPDGSFEAPLETEVRLHEKAPFGVVTFQFFTYEPGAGGQLGDRIKGTLTLNDFGTGAQSALPEKN